MRATELFLEITFAGGDVVTVTNDNTMTPAAAIQGQTGVPMQKLNFSTDANTATWTALRVNKIGTSTLDSDVAAVKIYRDDGNGTFSGADTLIGSGVFSGGTVNIDITDQTLSTTAQAFFVVFDINNTATTGVTVGSRIANETAVTVTSPDTVNAFTNSDSGLLTINPAGDTVTVTPASVAPVSAEVGTANVALARFTLTTSANEATWTNVRVDLGGTGAGQTDVSTVKIYSSTDPNFDPAGDSLIGSGAFNPSKYATIDIVDQTITTAVSNYYFGVYDISPGANPNAFLSLKFGTPGSTYFTLLSPDNMSNNNLPFETS